MTRRPRNPRRRPDDSAIFDRWAEEQASDLYRFAYRLCGESAGAEDLVQETFYEVWKHRGPLRGIREPRAWLFLILRRRYARLRRFVQRRPWFVSLGSAEAESVETAQRVSRIEAADSLQAALDGMSDLFKMPLLMVIVQGLTCAQAAEALDLPLGTVLSRLHRAKQHLRDVIRRQESVRASEPRAEPGGSAADDQPRLRIGGA
ncbi:MAG: sigma-70 family RNA polymerase sigma factor [Phycisphaerales bacterium]